jgi:glycosyltransferase involved in cell wall biosynthesis
MLERLRVVVVVPAYREELLVGRVLSSMPRWVDAIVVVDDASPDGTGRSVRAFPDPQSRIRLVTHAHNRGVGAAIVTGYREGAKLFSGEPLALAVMAGDGQMDPHDLEAVVSPIARGEADYVKGNRFVTASIERMPLGRYVGGRVFSRLTAMATGLAIDDSQCGYTAISREALERLDLDDLWPGFGYPNDLLGQCAVRGLRVTEVPVQAVYVDEVSKLRAAHLPTIGWLVARAYLRRRFR